jgi:putative hydrolase of HD superfamily
MDKAKNVIDYYVTCNRLKNIIRTGWKDWGVERQRVESVAEHIYGVQMLAISMWSEYNYDIDLKKVLSMLAIHELEETVIGDLTMFQIGKEEKEALGHKAVKEILGRLALGYKFEDLIMEFDERATDEARFAYQCDKLECDLQCRIYDEEGCVDLTRQESNKTAQNEDVKRLLNSGMTWSEMWLMFGQSKYPYDENFRAVSNYAMTHKVLDVAEKNDML